MNPPRSSLHLRCSHDHKTDFTSACWWFVNQRISVLWRAGQAAPGTLSQCQIGECARQRRARTSISGKDRPVWPLNGLPHKGEFGELIDQRAAICKGVHL